MIRLMIRIIAVILCVGAIATCIYLKAGNETSELVVKMVGDLSASWSLETFKQLSEPGLVAEMDRRGGVAQVLQVYSKLGRLKKPAVCQLRDTSSIANVHSSSAAVSESSSAETAGYECSAEYDKGHADITITLRRLGAADWKIYYINIASDDFDRLSPK